MSMWGGRFGGEMSEVTRRFTGDVSDRRLLDVDIEGSIAHVAMLGVRQIIPEDDARVLADGLRTIRAEGVQFSTADEDVHSAVERRLAELVGDVAGKLHTGRSRNDQIATDLRLYVRKAAGQVTSELARLVETLIARAEGSAEVPIPTYTHLQQAQITSLGNHLLAYAWMATRDIGRLRDVVSRSDVSPLGAGASGGSSLPLDRSQTAGELGFRSSMTNTLDAVASRDFVSEYVFACAQAMVHLSRFAEELVLWASSEFSWVTLGDSVSTGSSALPQKRNPDIAELVRGRAAGVIGDVSSILALQKGLALTYNRDLQEDKRTLFHAHDTLVDSVVAMIEMLSDVDFHPAVPKPETGALLLAERLVTRGVPFREAHAVVGELIKSLEQDDLSLADVTPDRLVEHDDRFVADDLPLEPVLPDLRDQISDLREML